MSIQTTGLGPSICGGGGGGGDAARSAGEDAGPQAAGRKATADNLSRSASSVTVGGATSTATATGGGGGARRGAADARGVRRSPGRRSPPPTAHGAQHAAPACHGAPQVVLESGDPSLGRRTPHHPQPPAAAAAAATAAAAAAMAAASATAASAAAATAAATAAEKCGCSGAGAAVAASAPAAAGSSMACTLPPPPPSPSLSPSSAVAAATALAPAPGKPWEDNAAAWEQQQPLLPQHRSDLVLLDEQGRERLKVYSDIFEEVILRDEMFGPTLRKVKNVYDAFLLQVSTGISAVEHHPAAVGGGGAHPTQAKAPTPTPPLTRRTAGICAQGGSTVAEEGESVEARLERENRELRLLTERLRRELEEERAGRAQPIGQQLQPTTAAANSSARCWAPPPPFQAAALPPGATAAAVAGLMGVRSAQGAALAGSPSALGEGIPSPSSASAAALSAASSAARRSSPLAAQPPAPLLPGPPALDGGDDVQDLHSRQRRSTAPAGLARQRPPAVLSWSEPPDADDACGGGATGSSPRSRLDDGSVGETTDEGSSPSSSPTTGRHLGAPPWEEVQGSTPLAGNRGALAAANKGPGQRRPPQVPALAFSRLSVGPEQEESEASVAAASAAPPPPPPNLVEPPPPPPASAEGAEQSCDDDRGVVEEAEVGMESALLEEPSLDFERLPQRAPFGQGPRPPAVPRLDLAALAAAIAAEAAAAEAAAAAAAAAVPVGSGDYHGCGGAVSSEASPCSFRSGGDGFGIEAAGFAGPKASMAAVAAAALGDVRPSAEHHVLGRCASSEILVLGSSPSAPELLGTGCAAVATASCAVVAAGGHAGKKAASTTFAPHRISASASCASLPTAAPSTVLSGSVAAPAGGGEPCRLALGAVAATAVAAGGGLSRAMSTPAVGQKLAGIVTPTPPFNAGRSPSPVSTAWLAKQLGRAK
mmetsp:Transcript_132429/g.330253  ORF Transcript_132429/g.330253 Transcript_132429/m.330253 type:complete len:937 (+) Transcript_132429:917-3727(+)